MATNSDPTPLTRRERHDLRRLTEYPEPDGVELRQVRQEQVGVPLCHAFRGIEYLRRLAAARRRVRREAAEYVPEVWPGLEGE